MKLNAPSRRAAGFTLVELLVVISIIALLAGLGLGAINQGRERANRILSVNNLKNIGTAIKIYASDYDGQYPIGWIGGSNITDTAQINSIADANTAFRALFGNGYCTDEKIFFYPGPNYFKKGDNNYKDNNYESALAAGENSYCYFVGLSESDDTAQPVACDTPQGNVSVQQSSGSGSSQNTGWTLNQLSPKINKGQGLHMLYVDGSVSFVNKTGNDTAAKVFIKVANPNGKFVAPKIK